MTAVDEVAGGPSVPSIDAIRQAARRIAESVVLTAVVRSPALDRISGAELWFKLECLQITGSFKLRGAVNAVLSLRDGVSGVVTHSSGNHARALSYAARKAGLQAHVAMPSDAPEEKIAAVRAEGATLVLCEPTPHARAAAAQQLCDRTGATLVPPSDHHDVIAGQGTVGLELLAQVPGLDAVVVPVGGGGLLAGVAIAARGVASAVRVIGAEPSGADDATRSKAAGRHLPLAGPAKTIADGLRAPLVARAWGVVRDEVDDVVSVDDEAIVDAMRLIQTHLGLLVEPSAAASLAAVLATPAVTGRVGVVLTGGNTSPSRRWAGRA